MMLDTIVSGTRNMLEFAAIASRRLPVDQFRRDLRPQPAMIAHVTEENRRPRSDDPGATYSESKRLAELLCTLYHQQYGLAARSPAARFCGPLPAVDLHFAIGNFIRDGYRRANPGPGRRHPLPVLPVRGGSGDLALDDPAAGRALPALQRRIEEALTIAQVAARWPASSPRSPPSRSPVRPQPARRPNAMCQYPTDQGRAPSPPDIDLHHAIVRTVRWYARQPAPTCPGGSHGDPRRRLYRRGAGRARDQARLPAHRRRRHASERCHWPLSRLTYVCCHTNRPARSRPKAITADQPAGRRQRHLGPGGTNAITGVLGAWLTRWG